MLASHWAAGTWRRQVDMYITASDFAKRKFVEGGLPADKITVKPHFLQTDPGVGDGHGGYALFVGRLSPEKGISTLLDAWRMLADIPLIIVGGGECEQTGASGVTWLGPQPRIRVYELMRAATVVIVPSLCYETGPLTAIEAFGCGTPVIASNVGSTAERVEHMRTGLLFRPADAQDLARQVRWAWEHPEQMLAMRAEARREYVNNYTAERNYKSLIEIYGLAIENARRNNT
jgi:glycosyltransferase involved in cell wall biosynthesis